MKSSRKSIMDRFQNYLNENYESYCARHEMEKTNERFVTFLIDQDLIPGTCIRRYSVLKEFERLAKEDYNLNKTQTVNTIAHRYNISERTVWNILRNKEINKD